MKKAIFFDIDGTLIDARAGVPHFSPRLRAALNNLQNAGHYIFIATGRPRAFLQKEILDFGFDGFMSRPNTMPTMPTGTKNIIMMSLYDMPIAVPAENAYDVGIWPRYWPHVRNDRPNATAVAPPLNT